VKDWIVAAVNGITPVDIGDHGVSDFLRASLLIAVDLLEICLLMCACMCAQHRLVVDVIGIRARTPWVVRREAQDVEVLRGRDDGVLLRVVAEDGRGELALNELTSNGERVVLVQVESSPDMGQDCVGSVGPLVGGVGIALDLDICL